MRLIESNILKIRGFRLIKFDYIVNLTFASTYSKIEIDHCGDPVNIIGFKYCC